VQAVDKAPRRSGWSRRRSRPAARALPLVGTFYRETPGADARSLEQFYRLRDRVEGAVGSIHRYEKADDELAADARKAAGARRLRPDAGATLERVRAADKALTDVRDGVNQVFANRNSTPDEKKELLDRLYER
jgi:hypothetical protein